MKTFEEEFKQELEAHFSRYLSEHGIPPSWMVGRGYVEEETNSLTLDEALAVRHGETGWVGEMTRLSWAQEAWQLQVVRIVFAANQTWKRVPEFQKARSNLRSIVISLTLVSADPNAPLHISGS